MVTVCVWSLAGAPARGGTQRWLLLRRHERTREDAAPWLGAGAALLPPGGAGGPHAGAVRGTGSHPGPGALTLTLAHRAIGVQWTLCWRNPFPCSLLEVPGRPEKPWVGRM